MLLRALERIALATVRAAGIPRHPRAGTLHEREFRYSEMRRTVWPISDSATRRRDATGRESTLAARGLFRYGPVVGHGDLYASHVLRGLGDTGITGILDWEDCSIGDPAGNTAVLRTGSGFVLRVLELWRGRDEVLWKRAGLRLHYAFGTNLLHWLRQGNREKVAEWERRYLATIPEMTHS